MRTDMRKSLVLAFAAATLAFAAPSGAGDAKSMTTDFEAFEVGKLPKGFSTALTGGGGPGAWAIQEDANAASGKKVLAQTSADDTDYRFPLCVYDELTAKDVDVTVKFKAIEGKTDRAGGIAVRLKDKDNYYLTRANALEDNVRFYKVVDGNRKQLAGADRKISSGEWHTLRLSAKGKHFVVSFDGERVIEHDDETFSNAGKVALWTKADSVTSFDDLSIQVE
jgi:hypothetical protein